MKLTTIDPNQGNIPETALIQKVISENDRLPNGEHEKAVQAFFRSDSIASGIGKDFAFVEKIPQILSDIIDNKSWECLYVSRGVVTPYYCRYTKGTDNENFRAFISAKRPNGLETTIETIDRLLEADLEVRNKFRTVIYESRQGERTDLDDNTSRLEGGKLDELSNRQQERVRAANRAAEAIPEIRELLDRGLIAIDIAAKLGREIKDPDNLTAEEREYVNKRDLIGLRIRQYIYTSTIPEDEDFEPAYSRKLNEFVKDLLEIKDRSRSVRMDDPKKAAKKLLEFYEGEKLSELLNYLMEGLELNISEPNTLQKDSVNNQTQETSLTQTHCLMPSDSESRSSSSLENGWNRLKKTSAQEDMPINPFSDEIKNNDREVEEETSEEETDRGEDIDAEPRRDRLVVNNPENTSNLRLSRNQLAERLKVNPRSISNVLYQHPDRFSQWTQKKDPEELSWQTVEKKGRRYVFAPIQTANQK